VNQFADALGFNRVIAGTAAHAKNYSVLLVPVVGCTVMSFFRET